MGNNCRCDDDNRLNGLSLWWADNIGELLLKTGDAGLDFVQLITGLSLGLNEGANVISIEVERLLAVA